MDYYELELARREDELEDMRQAERDENRFLLAIIAILSAGAGAALMLAGTALVAMLFVLSYPGMTSPAQASIPAPAASPAPTGVTNEATAEATPEVTAEATAEVTAEPTPQASTETGVEPAVPTAPPSTEAPPVFTSGGLGMTKAEWESVYGSPIGMVNGAARYGADGALTLDVVFLDDVVQSIDWQSAQPVAADAALTNGQALLPPDVVQISSYAPPERPTTAVTLYISESLAQRLGGDPKWWNNEEPGTALLEYDVTPAGVSRLIVSTGGRPGSNP